MRSQKKAQQYCTEKDVRYVRYVPEIKLMGLRARFCQQSASMCHHNVIRMLRYNVAFFRERILNIIRLPQQWKFT